MARGRSLFFALRAERSAENLSATFRHVTTFNKVYIFGAKMPHQNLWKNFFALY